MVGVSLLSEGCWVWEGGSVSLVIGMKASSELLLYYGPEVSSTACLVEASLLKPLPFPFSLPLSCSLGQLSLKPLGFPAEIPQEWLVTMGGMPDWESEPAGTVTCVVTWAGTCPVPAHPSLQLLFPYLYSVETNASPGCFLGWCLGHRRWCVRQWFVNLKVLGYFTWNYAVCFGQFLNSGRTALRMVHPFNSIIHPTNIYWILCAWHLWLRQTWIFLLWNINSRGGRELEKRGGGKKWKEREGGKKRKEERSLKSAMMRYTSTNQGPSGGLIVKHLPTATGIRIIFQERGTADEFWAQ